MKWRATSGRPYHGTADAQTLAPRLSGSGVERGGELGGADVTGGGGGSCRIRFGASDLGILLGVNAQVEIESRT